MVVTSYVHTSADQEPQPHYAPNANFTIDQISAFLAGNIGEHAGGFFQITYGGVGRAFAWDNLDLRVTSHESIGGSDVLVGMTLNNNPTVQDNWNTLPAWGFPYTNSDLSPAPATGTIIDGGIRDVDEMGQAGFKALLR